MPAADSLESLPVL